MRDWLPILVYHSVSESVSPAFRKYCVPPALFREHLDCLAARGHQTLTVTDAVRQVTADGGFADHAVVLTFDDAFADFADSALPALHAAGCVATLYVPTAYVASTSSWLTSEGEQDRRVMAWDQLRDAAGAGIEIGAHTHTHPQLDRLNRETLAAEIARPKALLEDKLGREALSFAYPFGFHNARVRLEVQKAGYRSACAVGNLSADARSNLWAIPRWTITNTTDAGTLCGILSHRSSSSDRIVSDAKRTVWRARRRLLPGRAVRREEK